ncbi:DMT family transporter [Spirosoma rhododendri]|uniref:DMT family transporter n=1 Tax=Spirosoma rhododendri TaxID=2728024 RepID=A0A7L5DNW9_9BACT|nr:DMT family transporter [Spirosoma rhododendri]QJD77757.1 DMT family transporter [Spirosoma rhododendri]
MDDRKRYWVGAGLVLLSAFCFACKGILIKLAFRYPVDPIALLTLRMAFSLPFYLAIGQYLKRIEGPVSLSRREWVALAAVGITGYYFASLFNFIGLVYISASLERILLFIYPTFVLLLNAVGFSRRVTRQQVIALLLTYSGILLAFVGNIGASAHTNVMLGAFWVILSGLVYALYLVGSESVMRRLGSQRFTCYAMVAATVPTVLHGVVAHGEGLFHYPMPVYGLGLIMAIFVTVVPTFMMAEGIRRVGAGNTSIIASIGPIFTIGLSTAILHEVITWQQVAGTGLVLLGVFLTSWKTPKKLLISSNKYRNTIN